VPLRVWNSEVRAVATGLSDRVDEQINDALRSQLAVVDAVQIRGGAKVAGLKQRSWPSVLGCRGDHFAVGDGRPDSVAAMDNLLRIYFAFPRARGR